MIVFGAPRRYVQGAGLIGTLGEEISRIGRRAVLLADDRVSDLVGEQVQGSCQAAGVELRALRFGGEITHAEVERLVGLVNGYEPDVVVAAGGGKSIDCGKLVRRAIGARFVSVPTIASNDAPTSHIAVVYDESHKIVGVEKTAGNPDLVLVDTAVIARAPLPFLAAGVGDALVKVFEVEQSMAAGAQNMFGASAPRTALALARACYATVRESTEAAYGAQARGMPDAAFEALVEACVLMSGLAFESGGLSVSHGMTRGLSAVPGVAHALHGHQVAYGLLVQLQLEGRDPAFMEDIRAFYRLAHLPLKLADLGQAPGSNSTIHEIARVAAEAAHMKKFDRPVTAEGIGQAIERIEAA